MWLLFLAVFSDPVVYGAQIHAETPRVDIAALMAEPDAYLDKMVVVEGKVAEVCPKRGCWMDIKDKDAKVRIKVKDGEIVFDQGLVGKTVAAEGTVYKFDLTKEQAVSYLAHLAEERGETFDASTVTEGMTIYQIGGLGAQVLQ